MNLFADTIIDLVQKDGFATISQALPIEQRDLYKTGQKVPIRMENDTNTDVVFHSTITEINCHFKNDSFWCDVKFTIRSFEIVQKKQVL